MARGGHAEDGVVAIPTHDAELHKQYVARGLVLILDLDGLGTLVETRTSALTTTLLAKETFTAWPDMDLAPPLSMIGGKDMPSRTSCTADHSP